MEPGEGGGVVAGFALGGGGPEGAADCGGGGAVVCGLDDHRYLLCFDTPEYHESFPESTMLQIIHEAVISYYSP